MKVKIDGKTHDVLRTMRVVRNLHGTQSTKEVGAEKFCSHCNSKHPCLSIILVKALEELLDVEQK